MNYFLKKKKWLAWVIMLTFLFTSFMPSNIMAGNSVAMADDTSSTFNHIDIRSEAKFTYLVDGKEHTIKIDFWEQQNLVTIQAPLFENEIWAS